MSNFFSIGWKFVGKIPRFLRTKVAGPLTMKGVRMCSMSFRIIFENWNKSRCKDESQMFVMVYFLEFWIGVVKMFFNFNFDFKL